MRFERIALHSLLAGAMLLIFVLPLGAVFEQAFAGGWPGFVRAVTSPIAVRAFELTVVLAVVVAILNTAMGLLIAVSLERWRAPLSMALDAVIDLPLAIPTAVSGLMLVLLYGPASPVGRWLAGHGVSIVYTRLGILFALVFVTVPYAVRALQPALQQLDRREEEAAWTLGAHAHRVWLRVILPALRHALGSAFVLTLTRAMIEFGSVVMVSGNKPMQTEVAAVYIYGLLENYDQQGASAAAVVLMLLCAIAFALEGSLLTSLARRRRHADPLKEREEAHV
ncbi:ABC transporter permease [Alicyclobacillus fructus]|uniref:ABC transporter permease n=1 Tax=Alicyclobacillus fructus TaxID=2816082 RepID=UPI001A8CECFD|nr:ABC transporter permease subunit [Alicyclobacillus fructus]